MVYSRVDPKEHKKFEYAKILSSEANRAVVQMPGRSFPGAVLQGDQLLQLLQDVDFVYGKAKEEAGPNVQGALKILRNRILAFYDNLERVRESAEKEKNGTT
jgi:hypothetical protein